jgi:chitodextrinase
VPEPGNEAPNLSDAAFKPGARGHFSDAGPAGWIDNYDADPTGTALLWMFAYDCLTFDVLSMSGDGLGPATAPGDLTGTVQFNIGTGCGPFNYGLGNLPNTAPSPAATYRPADPKAGDTVTFDGSASSDDFTTRSGLIYEWDLDGDGAFEASGQVVTHAFAAAGAKNVTLRVTDAGGLSATEDIALTVLPAPATPTPPQATATVAATATPAPSGTSQEQASTQPTPRPTRTPRR